MLNLDSKKTSGPDGLVGSEELDQSPKPVLGDGQYQSHKDK